MLLTVDLEVIYQNIQKAYISQQYKVTSAFYFLKLNFCKEALFPKIISLFKYTFLHDKRRKLLCDIVKLSMFSRNLNMFESPDHVL